MSDTGNILNQKSGQAPDDDKLLAYAEGRLSLQEQYEVEQWLSEEGMESDAVDGLKELSTEEAKLAAGRINHRLAKRLSGKKDKRRYFKDGMWSRVALIVILLLAVLAYWVIRMALKK